MYIDGRKLDIFYGKDWHYKFVDETDLAYTMDKKVELSEGHFFLAGDVWWRSGILREVHKDIIKGKVIGWTGKNGSNS